MTMETQYGKMTTCQKCFANYLGSRCPRCGLAPCVSIAEKAHAAAYASRQPMGRMNKTEARYAMLLDGLRAVGEVDRWSYESIKFRLADATFYTPDFFVEHSDGTLALHEVKGGFVRDDARVKFKVAAEAFPMFAWRMVQWKGGEWRTIKDYSARRETRWSG